jgi:hypothetical protein
MLSTKKRRIQGKRTATPMCAQTIVFKNVLYEVWKERKKNGNKMIPMEKSLIFYGNSRKEKKIIPLLSK